MSVLNIIVNITLEKRPRMNKSLIQMQQTSSHFLRLLGFLKQKANIKLKFFDYLRMKGVYQDLLTKAKQFFSNKVVTKWIKA